MAQPLVKFAGKFRLLFGFCPECNSDAPKLYECPVCCYNKYKNRDILWTRFLEYHKYHDNYMSFYETSIRFLIGIIVTGVILLLVTSFFVLTIAYLKQ